MKKLVVATHNRHKVDEIKAILKGFDIEILCLTDFKVYFEEPVEDGDTYYENARIKAVKARDFINLPIISDDSGLEIVSLGDEPGMQSARYATNSGGYDKAFEKIFERLKDKKRDARFVCNICYLNEKGKDFSFLGVCQGSIANNVEGESGFGYDPIFIPEGYKQTFASIGEEKKNKISHRAKALLKLMDYLKVPFKK